LGSESWNPWRQGPAPQTDTSGRDHGRTCSSGRAIQVEAPFRKSDRHQYHHFSGKDRSRLMLDAPQNKEIRKLDITDLERIERYRRAGYGGSVSDAMYS